MRRRKERNEKKLNLFFGLVAALRNCVKHVPSLTSRILSSDQFNTSSHNVRYFFASRDAAKNATKKS